MPPFGHFGNRIVIGLKAAQTGYVLTAAIRPDRDNLELDRGGSLHQADFTGAHFQTLEPRRVFQVHSWGTIGDPLEQNIVCPRPLVRTLASAMRFLECGLLQGVTFGGIIRVDAVRQPFVVHLEIVPEQAQTEAALALE